MSSIRSLLNEIFDQANPENENHLDLYHFFAERRGTKGWFAVSHEPRYYGDDGIYLGQDGIEALDTIRKYMSDFDIPENIAIEIKNQTIKNRHRKNKCK